MNYEEAIELEENVKVKNEAEKICKDFKKFIKLNVDCYCNLGFKVWNDANNAIYVSINDGIFCFSCRFLHNSYDVIITPPRLFIYIKNNYKGVGHLTAFIGKSKLE